MTRRSLLATLAVLLLTACGSAEPAAPVVEGGGEPEGAWVLVDARPAIEVPNGARVTMEVVAEGDVWQVGGTAACNSYGGTVVIEGGTWRTEGYGATEMGCEEPLMAAEGAYLDALGRIDAWTRPSPDELVLEGPDVELRFESLPPAPTPELTATTWVLDGLVVGTDDEGSVSSTVTDADEATLRLEPDGAVAVTTGCRSFTGTWTGSGDEIDLVRFGVRDDSPDIDADTACPEAVEAQEDHVLSVLGGGFRTAIDGTRLTVTSRDGLGLSYRPAED